LGTTDSLVPSVSVVPTEANLFSVAALLYSGLAGGVIADGLVMGAPSGLIRRQAGKPMLTAVPYI
jgi:hypothetical protein